MLRILLITFLVGFAQIARGELSIEITGAGEHQTPVSIVRFAGDTQSEQSVSNVISNDLLRTGLFKLIDAAGKVPHDTKDVRYDEWPGVEALLIGSVAALEDGKLTVSFRLLDMVRRKELLRFSVSAPKGQTRAIAHRISDMVYERLTGAPGVFSTRIAYVNRDGTRYRLVVADSDGYGEQTLLSSQQPLMSPSWSPDGSQIAYVSFEQERAMVYIQSLRTRQRLLLAEFPGSNSSPVWSPDGRRLALVLTRDDYSQIYVVNDDGTGLHRVTFSEAIDTEPDFSPDGKTLLFTSDRGGSPKVYRVPVEGGAAERESFETGSSFSPRFHPDGKGFVFSLYTGGKFYIATQDLASKQVQILTAGGWEKKPSYAPNGKLILFATEIDGRGILSTVSSDGRVKQKMVAQQGDIREPVWGPYLK